jgi:acetolactate synthase-1/2/3 large subunit
VRHEQGAAHAAEGYARSTGKVGVVLVTSGPGATNAVTGLTDALMDSIPMVCITGQVPTHLIGSDAFQECDTVGITRACTKHNYLVKTSTTCRACCTRPSTSPPPAAPARCGRHPQGRAVRRGTYTGPSNIRAQDLPPQIEGRCRRKIEQAVELMAKAEAPGLLHRRRRHQCRPRGVSELLRELVARSPAFPITSTLMGLGAYPGFRPAVAGHAGHARHLRSQPWRCTTAT